MKNETIQVDGKFYNRSKVVMLPTEKASKLIFDNDLQELKYHPSGIRIDLLNVESYQHLYFLSSEAIVEGDWYSFNGFIEQAGKCGQLNIKAVNGFMRDINDCKKIIATTDESLIIPEDLVDEVFGDGNKLLRPSNEFLQAYCKANGKIDEVLVEITPDGGFDYFYKSISPENCSFKLKVAPDNTITIKKIGEQKYSAEEIDKRVNMYNELVEGIRELLNELIYSLSNQCKVLKMTDEQTIDAINKNSLIIKYRNLLNQSSAK